MQKENRNVSTGKEKTCKGGRRVAVSGCLNKKPSENTRESGCYEERKGGCAGTKEGKKI